MSGVIEDAAESSRSSGRQVGPSIIWDHTSSAGPQLVRERVGETRGGAGTLRQPERRRLRGRGVAARGGTASSKSKDGEDCGERLHTTESISERDARSGDTPTLQRPLGVVGATVVARLGFDTRGLVILGALLTSACPRNTL
jgi:hypothetical protein